MNAACPPAFCASAITCSVSVVLPPDSGPYTSTTRPRGRPPTPSAASSETEPVEITLTGTRTSRFPRRMIEPLPNVFSICAIADSRIFAFSSVIIHLERGNRFRGRFLRREFTRKCTLRRNFPFRYHLRSRRKPFLRQSPAILPQGEEKANTISRCPPFAPSRNTQREPSRLSTANQCPRDKNQREIKNRAEIADSDRVRRRTPYSRLKHWCEILVAIFGLPLLHSCVVLDTDGVDNVAICDG